ncbi:hypothetical protein B0J14DRAFT_571874 [Halenospora varia]|nr:hypothetical protein B0J14DRAFT_571874 [Halenospora varia]
MQLLKYGTIAAFVAILAFTDARPQPPIAISKIPTTIIAGVAVPNTPIVRAAQTYARAHSDDMTYNHVMRSWLFGTIIINKNATQRSAIDPETHAVAAILHDLGWDNTSELISPDKRFEVDGAIAAWNFIEAAVSNGTAEKGEWGQHRKQQVWDSIALHTTPSISRYSQPIVAMTGNGIFSDFGGPNTDMTGLLTWDEYYRVKEAFPRHDLGPSVSKIACGFAKTKPSTTYDNWMQPFGDRYVENYTQEAKGKLGIDMVEGALPN